MHYFFGVWQMLEVGVNQRGQDWSIPASFVEGEREVRNKVIIIALQKVCKGSLASSVLLMLVLPEGETG